MGREAREQETGYCGCRAMLKATPYFLTTPLALVPNAFRIRKMVLAPEEYGSPFEF
jgi:hypothetical protein